MKLKLCVLSLFVSLALPFPVPCRAQSTLTANVPTAAGILDHLDHKMPKFVLKPGSTVVILTAPSKVECEPPDENPPFVRYCKCALEGFTPTYTLNLMLDDQGNYDVLGNYPTQDQCEKALSGNPACYPPQK